MVLEELLKQVKKIKSQKYVGTQEALNFIRAKRELEKRPLKITEEVNKQLGEVIYKATPERIVAIHKIYEGIRNKEGISIFRWCDRLESIETPFFNYSAIKNKVDISLNEKYIVNFVKILKKANNGGVKNDDELFDFILNKYLPSYLKEKKIKKKLSEKPSKFNFNVAYEEVKDFSTGFIFAEVINNTKIIKRMQRDRVEFQTEFKRQIIDNDLGNLIDAVTYEESRYKPEELNKDSLYQAITGYLDDRVKDRKERLESMEKIKAPKVFLDALKDSYIETKVFREFFGREKNYVLKKLELFLEK